MQQSKSVAIVLGHVVVCNKSKDVWSEGSVEFPTYGSFLLESSMQWTLLSWRQHKHNSDTLK